MRVLVACEFSGVVREAFRKRGHHAVSCDLLPSEIPSPYHYTGNVKSLLFCGDRELRVRYLGHNSTETEKNTKFWEPYRFKEWDLLIAFPPCTHLCVSGARWFKDKQDEQHRALDFVRFLMAQPIGRIAIENPIGVISTKIRKPDQIIQPWQFGHGETKATCLWLKNLPKLEPTNIVEGREQRIFRMPPGPNRGMERSRTYRGIADAMAEQWG